MAGKSKHAKKKEPTASERKSYNMKIVTSEVCVACKSKCARGIRYMESMAMPGAVGRGVPCILTRYKS